MTKWALIFIFHYAQVLGEPGSHKAERLLHTFYTDRSANSRANK
jgi:hypothetical protein